MFEWWTGLHPRARKAVALILICISTGLAFDGEIWIWGWAIGAVLFMFSGPSWAEKNGYRW